MEVIFSKTFRKHFQKMAENHKMLEERVIACVSDISKNGRGSSLYRKRFKGALSHFEELAIGGDVRILVRFHPEKEIVVFEEIGTHAFFGW